MHILYTGSHGSTGGVSDPADVGNYHGSIYIPLDHGSSGSVVGDASPAPRGGGIVDVTASDYVILEGRLTSCIFMN